MKKNISINIGGIIFHIEEDGYENLKSYLTSINNYFSSYEDSSEIISDIESRIAEIFLTCLNENKQIITQQDVESLIATMGRVADFEEAELYRDESYYEGNFQETVGGSTTKQRNRQQEKREETPPENEPRQAPRRLYRDMNQKILGGVASGIAHYFHIDPLWVRLLLLLTFFDFISFFTITGVVTVAYITLWLLLPGSYELEQDSKTKRLFRDPEERVLGGVAGGVAKYFGANISLVRILFVASFFFGGLGLIVYLTIWFTTPEAKSITERMQMEGEPITLENIEKKIKETLHMDEEDEESLLTRILLFPFRLIARVLDFFTTPNTDRVLHFLSLAVTTVVGFLLSSKSVVLSLALFLLLAIYLGAFGNMTAFWDTTEVPYQNIEIIRNSAPPEAVIPAFVLVWIPIIFIGLLGVSLIARRWVASRSMSFSLLGVWVLGMVAAGIFVPKVVTDFQEQAVAESEVWLDLPEEELVIDMNPNRKGDFINEVSLTIRGHEDDRARLLIRTDSHGKDREQARTNARKANYSYFLEGNRLAFDSHYTLENAPFRGQEMQLKLFLPYNKSFEMTPQLSYILRHTLYPNDYRVHELKGNRWVFKKEKGLYCQTCNDTAQGNKVKEFTTEQFDRISLSGLYNVRIRQDDAHTVRLEGRDAALDNFMVEVNPEGILQVVYKMNADELSTESPLMVEITTPDLSELHLEGAMNVSIRNYETEFLFIDLQGSVTLDARLEVETLEAKVKGASQMELKGEADNFFLELDGASQTEASDFRADRVTVNARGISKAGVYARDAIEIMNSFGSSVNYRGNPEEVRELGME